MGFTLCFYWKALLWIIVVLFLYLIFLTLTSPWFCTRVLDLLRCALTSDILSLYFLGESALWTSSCLNWLLSFWDPSSRTFWKFPLLFYCVETRFLDFIFSSFLVHSFVLWSTFSHSFLKKVCGRFVFHMSENVFILHMFIVCRDRSVQCGDNFSEFGRHWTTVFLLPVSLLRSSKSPRHLSFTCDLSLSQSLSLSLRPPSPWRLFFFLSNVMRFSDDVTWCVIPFNSGKFPWIAFLVISSTPFSLFLLFGTLIIQKK